MSRRKRSPVEVAGPVADGALDALVAQFSQRSAFVRELIQNSLDAGAGRIDVVVEGEGRQTTVSVIDDGEGMDRGIIEGCLLTLFRSSKERDLTKIGKFGVGFVSLFALAPTLVVVDTARDGVHHRVVFAEDRTWTLVEVDEPFEGTTVRIVTTIRGKEAGLLAQEIRGAAHHWCRYAESEVWTEGRHSSWGWPPEEVRHEFAVDTPVHLLHEGKGARVAMGFTGTRPSFAGYYNHGLTLLEAEEDLVPGVAYRVMARTLEHTLTRDNVLRDAHHAAVIELVRGLARGALLQRWLSALQEAEAAGQEAVRATLLGLAGVGEARLPDALPCFHTAGGGRLTLAELRPGWLARGDLQILHATGPSPLVEALETAGHRILCAVPDAAVAARLLGATALPADSRWALPSLREPGPLLQATSALSGARSPLLAASFAGGGSAIVGRLAIRQERPGALIDLRRSPPTSAPILVDQDHPLVTTLAALPVERAAPLLLHAARIDLGGEEPPAAGLLLALAGSAP